jgi:hypothetical protein
VLAYGSETWVLSKSDKAILGAFERKILTAIFGSTNDNREWKVKYNNESYTLYKESDIITYIKINHLRWAGNVIGLEEQNPARRVFSAVVEGRGAHSAVVEALSYKLEGHGFDSRWCQWNFSLT